MPSGIYIALVLTPVVLKSVYRIGIHRLEYQLAILVPRIVLENATFSLIVDGADGHPLTISCLGAFVGITVPCKL